MQNQIMTVLMRVLFLSTIPGGIIMAAFQENPVPLTAQEVHPLAVGDTAPDGTLSMINGKNIGFRTLIAKKASVIIFYRGGWCPFCNMQMDQLVKIQPELKKLGYQVLAISPDKPEKLKESLKKHHINYTLLSDRTMEITRKFGLAYKVSQEIQGKMQSKGISLDSSTGNSLHMLPVPAAYVVDKNGIIRFVYFNADIKVRVNPEDLLSAAKKTIER
jgi:peroxiredoxin